MILVDHEIRSAVDSGWVTIDPYDPALVQPASYDVLLSDRFRVFDPQVEIIDTLNVGIITREVVVPDRPFVLHPGEFVLGSTVERFGFPADLVGVLNGRSSLGRLGLQVHSTAGFVDPGFQGPITLEISNIGNLPIRLHPNTGIAQMVFFRCGRAERPYGSPGLGSKYQNQDGPTESRL